MSESNEQIAIATPQNPLASSQLAAFIGMDKQMMLDTIKRQCFKGSPDNITDAQLASFVSVASALRINPLLPGFLYAYPTSNGGIQPIIGPDGIFKMLSEHKDIESWETEVFPADPAMPPTHATCKIWRKGIERPVIYTAAFNEWKVGSNPNWNTRPRHMLSIRALKQAARQLIHGLPFDEDERKIAEMVNVTDSAPAEAPNRAPAPEKAPTGVAAAVAAKKGPGRPRKADVIDIPATESQTEATTTQPTVTNEVKPSEQPVPPVHTLADGARGTFACKVKTFKVEMVKAGGKEQMSVVAELEGGFAGKVYHIGGANDLGDPDNGWQTEKVVEIELLGKARKDPSLPCVVYVQSIKLLEPVAQTAAPAARTGEDID